MIFNKVVPFEDGRVFNFHTIVDRKVDIAGKTIQPIIRSWETLDGAKSNAAGSIEFTLDLQFTTWNPSLLLDMEKQIVGLVWRPYLVGYVPPPVKTLADLKAEKSSALNRAAQAQIYAGYTSDALGDVYHYPAKDKDQTNMVASVTDSYNPAHPEGWTTPFWCADANEVWGYRLHTAAQIQKAGSDGKLAILASLSKNATLQSQVVAAETEAELSAIEW